MTSIHGRFRSASRCCSPIVDHIYLPLIRGERAGSGAAAHRGQRDALLARRAARPPQGVDLQFTK